MLVSLHVCFDGRSSHSSIITSKTSLSTLRLKTFCSAYEVDSLDGRTHSIRVMDESQAPSPVKLLKDDPPAESQMSPPQSPKKPIQSPSEVGSPGKSFTAVLQKLTDENKEEIVRLSQKEIDAMVEAKCAEMEKSCQLKRENSDATEPEKSDPGSPGPRDHGAASGRSCPSPKFVPESRRKRKEREDAEEEREIKAMIRGLGVEVKILKPFRKKIKEALNIADWPRVDDLLDALKRNCRDALALKIQDLYMLKDEPDDTQSEPEEASRCRK